MFYEIFNSYFYVKTICIQISTIEIAEFKRQSQSVQRDLPRPSDVNTSVLRPQDMYPDLNAYQMVCNFNSFVFLLS